MCQRKLNRCIVFEVLITAHITLLLISFLIPTIITLNNLIASPKDFECKENNLKFMLYLTIIACSIAIVYNTALVYYLVVRNYKDSDRRCNLHVLNVAFCWMAIPIIILMMCYGLFAELFRDCNFALIQLTNPVSFGIIIAWGILGFLTIFGVIVFGVIKCICFTITGCSNQLIRGANG